MEFSKKILIYKKLCIIEALFWTDYLHTKKVNILGKLQSEFYCNAYAVNAISKQADMDFSYLDQLKINM